LLLRSFWVVMTKKVVGVFVCVFVHSQLTLLVLSTTAFSLYGMY
jgi:hypothetical protein